MKKNHPSPLQRGSNRVQHHAGDALASRIVLLLQNGMDRHRSGDLAGAEALYCEVLRIQPAQPDALHLLGLIAHQVGQFRVALDFFEKAIRINPRYEVYFSNRGNTLKALQEYEAALASFDQAIRLKPDYADAYFNRGVVLQEMQRHLEALESYDRALALQPALAQAHNNRGNVLRTLRRYQEALESFEKAAQLNPQSADAYNNCGNVLLDLQAFQAAAERYDQALRLEPQLVQAHTNRAVAHLELKNYREAMASLDRALATEPDSKYLAGMRIHMKRHLCDWQSSVEESAELENMVREGRKVTTPFCMLSISDDPCLQKQAAAIYVSDTCMGVPCAPFPARDRHDKIRIGYFSSDFREHAVSYLMAEVFERHDKAQFEIIGISTGPDSQDPMRVRIRRAMDRFVDARPMPDSAIVQLSRKLEIDVAIDLNGLSYGDRTAIFAERAAPIQVNYIGYPGTMGAAFMDYILADEILIPQSSQEFYSEKIAYLPDCFQANDSSQRIINRRTRASEGLPETGFVYCCFNNNSKITPEVFDQWMRILSRVDGSVLWLLAGNPQARENLRKEARRRGVDPERLIFADSLPLDEHLGRQQLADLFLDTYPFNAGASASPALWAGLPILTRVGKSFAGRMGASLLHALKMPDLVTATPEEYVVRAVEIGSNAAVAKEIKDRLWRQRSASPLFDSARFTRNLEFLYRAMYERLQAGLEPDHIRVRSRAES